MENSFKKAFTARTFRIPSGEMERATEENPAMGAQFLTGLHHRAGRAAIKVGDDSSGRPASPGPGGEKDEACVKSGSTRWPTSSIAVATPFVFSIRNHHERAPLACCSALRRPLQSCSGRFPRAAQSYPDRPIRVIVPIAAAA